jgi:pyruvate ferredoxin oxidoreductase gamma subunit
MYAVRFHGRGGQGAKTASRILGTAAFLEGYQAQDSPIYGAERRGAPVAAYTRIAKEPIRERGVITRPDLVVVADASLIGDPDARVLEGSADRTAVFLNSPLAAEQVHAQFSIPGCVTILDLTGIALQRFGRAGAVSAPLGAVACRLLSFKKESVLAAVGQELSHLNLPAAVVERNVAWASECFESVPVVPVLETTAADTGPAPLWTPTYESPTKGTAMIAAGANSILRQTGGWRTFRPVLVPDKCNGCWLCFVYCPDGVISMTKDDLPRIDYDHCKGCQICVQECPTKALVAEREKEGAVSWRAR